MCTIHVFDKEFVPREPLSKELFNYSSTSLIKMGKKSNICFTEEDMLMANKYMKITQNN